MAQLVAAVAKVAHLDQTLVDERLQAVVDLAEADAEHAWKVALAQLGPGLDQPRQAQCLPWADRFWPAGSRSAGVWGRAGR